MRVYSKSTGVAVDACEEQARAMLEAGTFQKSPQKVKKAAKAEDKAEDKAAKAE